VADGSNYAVQTVDSGWSPKRPLGQFAQETPTDPEKWAEGFSRVLFSPGTGGKPISDLVAAAQAPGSGYEVHSEERVLIHETRTIPQRRILITRTAEQENKLGKLEIEVVLDKREMLPVTIRTNLERPNRLPQRVMWSAKWKAGPAKFTTDAFKIGEPEKPTRQRA
jgi:hypothetical protein